jgi:clan AA aspartic protease
MIRGTVKARLEAVVRLRVRGPGGVELDVDAVVDSGFGSSLSLPAAIVAALGLIPPLGGIAVLADGSTQRVDLHRAELEWGGIWRPVLVVPLGDQVLLGMKLLEGYRLSVEVVSGGTVEVVPLP